MSLDPQADDRGRDAPRPSLLERYFTATVLVVIVVVAIVYGLVGGGRIIGFDVTQDKNAGR